MDRFLGGNPLAVLLKLVLISVVVGIVLSQLGYDLYDFMTLFRDLVLTLQRMWYYWSDSIIGWLILGAAVVVPIWLIIRLFRLLGGDKKGGAKH
jgi:hypothetical protein